MTETVDTGAFTVRTPAWCAVCHTEKPLPRFRRLRDVPLLYADFCVDCEAEHGLQALYSDPNTAAAATPAARDFVLADVRAAEEQQAIAQREANREEESRRELARRELMRRRLIYYVTQFRPDYKAGWVHQDVARRLERFVERVERGESPRLMLFMPPRIGKSTLASDEFPSWLLGLHPDWEVISASYAVSLPIGFSRRIRDRIDDAAYQAVFPKTKVRSDSRGVEEWLTTEGGRFRAAGVEGGITGTGCHVLNIDDPIKDYAEAQSETVRENAYNWFTTTARTRLAPGGGILLTQTRWHDSDLAGRLLTDREALIEAGVPRDELDDWEVVSYAALADYDEYLMPDGRIEQAPAEIPDTARLLRRAGEALHPERYSAKALRTIRNTTPPTQWNALYQQNPTPESGEFFSSDMFRFYTVLPGRFEEYSFFSAWDLAIGERTANDWTVGVVGAMDAQENVYVVDMIRARMNTLVIVDSVVGLGKKWPLLQVVGLEDGQIRKTMAPLLKAAVRKAKSPFSLDDSLKPVTDKLVRARPLQQMMQMGRILLPSGQPWAAKAQQEMMRFPNGTHDDIVDAMAWLARMAQRITPPTVSPYKNRKLPESWKKELRKHVAGAQTNTYMTA